MRRIVNSDNSDYSTDSADIDRLFPVPDAKTKDFYGININASREQKIDAIVNQMKRKIETKTFDLRVGKVYGPRKRRQ